MHKVLIFLPVILAACAAFAPEKREPWQVAPVAREDASWAGCQAEGGAFRAGVNGGLVCVAIH